MSPSAQSAQTTVQSAFETLTLRGKDKTPPASIHSRDLLVAPLEPTGALDAYKHKILTPALGAEFDENVKLKQILALPEKERDAVLRDLAIFISTHGVVFFQDQSEITPDDLATLGKLLGELSGKPKESTLHIHPTQELGENGLPVGKISNIPEKGGRQISFADEFSSLASSGWHTDVSFEPVPSGYTFLKMHTLPSTGGDTLWNSSYANYDSLTPPLAAFLEGLTATHDAERFREQSRRNGFQLRTAPRGHPDNSGDAFQASHPIVRTNPVTGFKSLYVNTTFTKRINELSYDESAVLLDYLFKLQHQSHDHHVKYHWSVNNLAIWDNRAVTHLATFDYDEPRVGDRVVTVAEKPYFDPASVGRKAWNKAQAEAAKSA
ncbi:hypothetical protein MNV49_006587 [Pseudohyphozyma bogoriensis]|nr:hypothetical protein MNV49_006587 [Pseudohyphozyma bogoriensis]